MDHDPNSLPKSQLAERLADQAARLDVGAPVVEVVIQRGKQRQQRRRTAVGVMSVAGVCAAAIVSVNVLSRPPENRAVMSPGDTVAPTGSPYTPARLVESNLVWSKFEPDSAAAVSFLNGAAELTGDGPYVVWSTAPGINGGKATMWRSDDGLSWQQVDNVPVFSSANVVQHDGRFLAFGTSPAASTNGAGSVQSIASSIDGGTTWTTETLPIPTSGLEDEPGVASVTMHSTSIAAGPAGVLAVVRQSVNIDYENVLPADAQRYGYTITPLGVQIMEPSACDATSVDSTVVGTTPATVPPSTGPTDTAPADTAPADDEATTTVTAIVPSVTAVSSACSEATGFSSAPAGANTTMPMMSPAKTLTWAELGVSERAGAASVSAQNRLFFSADGVTFTEVSSPVADGVYADLRLTDTDDGFAAAVLTYDTTTGSTSNEVFHTTDGQSWTDLGPAPIANPESFSALSDRLVMSGGVTDSAKPSNPSTTAVAVRDPNGTWTSVLLNDLVLPSDGVITSLSGGGLAVGPDGITIAGMLYVDPIAEMGGLEIIRNGITMSAEGVSSPRLFTDESGTELGSVTNGQPTPDLITIDPQTGEYQVRLTDDDDVVATFSENDVYAEVPANGGTMTMFVLHSADGVAWSRESLSDLVGQPVSGTGGIHVTDTQIIVAANLAEPKNADGTSKQVLLLGTPKT